MCFLLISYKSTLATLEKGLGTSIIVIKTLPLKLCITRRFLLAVFLAQTVTSQGLAPSRPHCPWLAGGRPVSLRALTGPEIQTGRPLCPANCPGSEPGLTCVWPSPCDAPSRFQRSPCQPLGAASGSPACGLWSRPTLWENWSCTAASRLASLASCVALTRTPLGGHAQWSSASSLPPALWAQVFLE